MGDCRSWADWAEASADDEFWRDRPAKCRQSASRRWEGWPTLPFPLQDNDGRCASVQQLYHHAGEQPQARHNVAAQGLTHQYPDMEPCEARSLGNQVLCMTAEYHLTGLAQGSSSISVVLPEAATDLLYRITCQAASSRELGTRGLWRGLRPSKLQPGCTTWIWPQTGMRQPLCL